MRNKILLLTIFICAMVSIHAQEVLIAQRIDNGEHTPILNKAKSTFEFLATSQSESIKNISALIAGNHFLGDDIAKKVYLCNEMYSYKEPVAPGNSATKTIFRKPDIYSSVKKIERYLKKELKENEITLETAREQYNKVLDVALNILDVNTENFEKRLKSAGKDPAELLSVYLNEVKLEYIN